jgi:hypothetical protein
MTKQGNNVNPFTKISKRAFVAILFLSFMIFSSLNNNVYSQNTYVDMIYDAKVKKSPAKDIIPKADKLAENLTYDANNASNRLSFDTQKNEFITDYDTLISLKAEISKRDPKWKTKKIDECLTLCKPTYDKFKTDKINISMNKKLLDRNDLIIYKMEENFYEAAKNGELLSYYKGEGKYTYNWQQIMVICDSVVMAKEYLSKMKENHSTYYQERLYFFKKGDNPNYKTWIKNLVANINTLADYKDLPADANGEKRLSQYTNLSRTLNNIEACLLIEPNNAELKAAQTKVEALYSNVGKHFDNIVTGPFHKANLNKVFLSDHIITLGTESEKDFKTSFKGGETIYVTYYLPEKREAKNARKEQIFNSKDGLANTVKIYPIIEKYGKDSVSVVQYALVPAAGAGDDIKLSRLVEAMEKLNSQKEPNAPYWLRVSDNVEIKFDVTISPTENYKQALAAVRKAKTNTVNLPKTGMTDAHVSATVKKQIEEMTEEGYEDITVVKVIIQAKEWNVYTYRNTDVIKNRTLLEVNAICRDSKGKCFIMPGDFFQKREGGVYNTGYFEFSNFYDGTTDGRVGIDEDNRIYINCSKL